MTNYTNYDDWDDEYDDYEEQNYAPRSKKKNVAAKKKNEFGKYSKKHIRTITSRCGTKKEHCSSKLDKEEHSSSLGTVRSDGPNIVQRSHRGPRKKKKRKRRREKYFK